MSARGASGVRYLQDPLGQARPVSQAGPILSIRVVLLGKVRLQRSELLAAETSPNALASLTGPATLCSGVQPWFRTAAGLLSSTRLPMLSCVTHTNVSIYSFKGVYKSLLDSGLVMEPLHHFCNSEPTQ